MKSLLFSVTESDCRFDYYRGSGKGGQKRNKTSNCVRCTHEPSGAVAKSEDGRSQRKNKEAAFKRMATSKEFKTWHRLESARLTGRELETKNRVDAEMRNIRVEGKNSEGRWVELPKEMKE